MNKLNALKEEKGKKVEKLFDSQELSKIFNLDFEEQNKLDQPIFLDAEINDLIDHMEGKSDELSTKERIEKMRDAAIAKIPKDFLPSLILKKARRQSKLENQPIHGQKTVNYYNNKSTIAGFQSFQKDETIEQTLRDFMEVFSKGDLKSNSTMNTLSKEERRILNIARVVQTGNIPAWSLYDMKALLKYVGTLLTNLMFTRAFLNSSLEFFNHLNDLAHSDEFNKEEDRMGTSQKEFEKKLFSAKKPSLMGKLLASRNGN